MSSVTVSRAHQYSSGVGPSGGRDGPVHRDQGLVTVRQVGVGAAAAPATVRVAGVVAGVAGVAGVVVISAAGGYDQEKDKSEGERTSHAQPLTGGVRL